MKAKEAEMAKLVENTFRAVNIGLINELALVAHKMGINIWNVIEAAKTKPFGFTAFYPGPGLGGIASLLIRFISPGKPRFIRPIPALSSSQARSIARCLLMWWNEWPTF